MKRLGAVRIATMKNAAFVTWAIALGAVLAGRFARDMTVAAIRRLISVPDALAEAIEKHALRK